MVFRKLSNQPGKQSKLYLLVTSNTFNQGVELFTASEVVELCLLRLCESMKEQKKIGKHMSA